MSPEEELRLKALELAVQLRRGESGITGQPAVNTAIMFERYIKGERR